MPFRPERYDHAITLWESGVFNEGDPLTKNRKLRALGEYEFHTPDVVINNRGLLWTVQNFMKQYHYSQKLVVSTQYWFAITHKYVQGGIAGALAYGQPAGNNVYRVYSNDRKDVLELRRSVFHEYAPKNTESHFIAKSLDWLSKNTGYRIVVSYADKTFGHKGGIYRASNFKYDGETKRVKQLRLEDGSLTHERKIRGKGRNSRSLQERKKSGKIHDEYDDGKHRYHYHLFEHRNVSLDKDFKCERCASHESKPSEPKTIVKKQTTSNDDLLASIEKAWSKDTSFLPDDWTAENPALGQCCVSALLIQEHRGGKLKRCVVEGVTHKDRPYYHYLNVLPNGEELDITKRQFKPDVKFGKYETKQREPLLKIKSVLKRYQLLKQNMTALA